MFKLDSDTSNHIFNSCEIFETGKFKRSEQPYINKVLIVGAGSVGTLIGAILVKAGLDVTLAGRSQSKYTEQIKRNGLTISYPSRKIFSISPFFLNVRFVDTRQELKEKLALIVVAFKSNYLASVRSYRVNQH